MFGDLPPDSLGVTEAEDLRAYMVIERGWSRRTVNDRMARVRALWRWGRRWGLDTARVELSPLRKARPLEWDGRYFEVRECEERRAVPIETVVRTLRDPDLDPMAKDIIRVMLRTGMRPAEVCELEGREIDTTESPWLYEPAHHKMLWLEKKRVVLIGTRAQLILLPYMQDGPLFQTRYGKPWRVDSLRRAITRACDRRGISRWAPAQIRKRTATEAAKVSDFAARDILGHSDVKTTRKHYIDTRHSRDAQTFAAEFG